MYIEVEVIRLSWHIGFGLLAASQLFLVVMCLEFKGKVGHQWQRRDTLAFLVDREHLMEAPNG